MPSAAYAIVIIHNPALISIDLPGATSASTSVSAITYEACNGTVSKDTSVGVVDFVTGGALSPHNTSICEIEALPRATVQVVGANAYGAFKIAIDRSEFSVTGSDLPKILPYTVISGTMVTDPVLEVY